MNTIDFESLMVFDFLITNETIYAIYERLPFGRPALGNYAAFTFNVPLVATSPAQTHHLEISYDRAAGAVRWIVDGRGALLGRSDRASPRPAVYDHRSWRCARDRLAEQLACGMGMFTLLDADQPSGTALVRLSSVSGFYFDPAVGEPTPQTFLDDESLAGNRLFGQGAEIRVLKYVVSSRRTEP